jgi:[ribosomal protein S5]-alanine N-acetyltransferase
MQHPFLVGKKLYLKGIEQKDLEGRYFDWLNNYEITKYLESSFFPNTKEKMQEYFDGVAKSGNNVLLSIVDLETDKHIGNVRIGPINWVHRTSFLGIMIGERDFWGKGYASEVLQLVLDYVFNRLNLHKISAGANSSNKSSLRIFEKAGFKIEGRRKEELYVDGKYHDGIIMGLTKEDFSGSLTRS